MSAVSYDQRPARPFLGLFEPNKRSGVANVFLGAIRERGARNPAQVLAFVEAELRARIGWTAAHPELEYAQRSRQLLDVLQAHPSEADAEARYCLWYEDLPATEKAALKAGRWEQHRLANMAGQPASERQLTYLKALGHTGPAPASKAEASSLIDRLGAQR